MIPYNRDPWTSGVVAGLAFCGNTGSLQDIHAGMRVLLSILDYMFGDNKSVKEK